MENLKSKLNEGQDLAVVEKLHNKIKNFLTTNEVIEYIAVQKKPGVTITPDCVTLTTKRVIVCRPKSFGLTMEFFDYTWKDVEDCHVKEEIFGSEFSVKSVKGNMSKVDYIPKIQARRLYQLSQEKEEEQREIRRNLMLEEKKASASNLVVNQSESPSKEKTLEDPMVSLGKLKTLFENDLITKEEFERKKSEILARL